MPRGSWPRLALGRHVSIRWLLAGSYALLFGVMVVGLGSILYFQVASYLERAGEAQLRRVVVTGLDRTLENVPEGEEPALVRKGRHLQAPADLERRADEIAHGMGSRVYPVRILSASGEVLAEHPSPSRLPMPDASRLQQMRETAVRSGLGSSDWQDTLGRRAWRTLLVPLYRERQVAGFVHIGYHARPDRDLLLALRWYLLVGMMGAGAMGLVAAGWLFRVISVPLERLAHTTHQVAAGSLDARTGLDGGSNEIYAVAHDFDHMVGRLQEAFAAQRRFVADASHELKTPLTAIGGMAEMLAMGADGGDPAKRKLALATIEKEVDRMGRLVSDLLTLARAEQAVAGQAQGAAVSGAYRVEEVDVHRLLTDAAQEAGVLDPARKVEVRAEPALTVKGDRDHLERVLRNLVENAVKYSTPGGGIILVGRREGQEAVIEVTDAGPGIAPADLPHVFEPFFRADRSRARATGGSGLGLAIVRATVERHQGQVAIDSLPGVGTTVRIRLPLPPSP